ncbi:MAG TPA: hypothetical protein ENK02_01740 [Planctomycetes bacterium]|nr:hypothetical protein [Planctomycetota bacterium]
MVKKTGLFERLFGHKKEDSPRQGAKGAGRTAGPSSTTGGAARPANKGVAGERVGAKPAVPPKPASDRMVPKTPPPSPKPEAKKPAVEGAEPKAEKKSEVEMTPVRKVLGGKKEEALQALTDGFQNLSQLLEGIQGNLASQGKRADDLNEKVADLPVLAKAQVDFLTKVSGQLETQTARTGELLSKLSGLPELLDGIHKTLEKQVAAEERSEKTLQDFRKTMNNIHDSIGELTRENSKALKASTESLERTNKKTTQTFERAQSQAYASFERAQKANLTQLSAMMERSTKMNRTMIVLLAVLFAGLAVLFVLVLNGQAG